MKKNAKLLAMLLVFVTIFTLTAPALAAAREQVYATTPLNVRSGPGTNYPIVGELKKGQVVTRVGTSGNWSIIELGNAQVYASSAYLNLYGTGGNTGGNSQGTMYSTGKVNVRSGPGTGYKILSTVNKGDPVSTLGTVGNWTIIKWNSGTAYIFTKYLTRSGGSGGSGSGSIGVTSASGTMKANANVNVRSGPGSSYSQIGWLSKGETVRRTGISGSWTQVDYYGKTAYVYSTYLTLQQSGNDEPYVTPASGIVEATINVNVRTGPGTNYATLGELIKGERVTRTGISGDWTRIEYRNRTAFVFSSYLRVVSGNQPSTEKMYITTDTVLRAGPGSNYNSIITLLAGNTVLFIENSGSWSKIEYGSYTGYVPAANLSRDAITSSPGMAYAPNGATIYASSSASSTILGTLQAGEGLVSDGTVGSWTRVTYKSGVAYIRTTDIVLLTESSQTGFTSGDRTMYSKGNNLAVYTIPSDTSTAYRYGYLLLDEQVRRLAYNSTWTKIYADGRVLYTRTANLKETLGGATGPVGGDSMSIVNTNGAMMYLDSTLTTPYIIQDGSGNPLTDRIPYGAAITYRETYGGAYRVHWAAYNVAVYISAADAALVTP